MSAPELIDVRHLGRARVIGAWLAGDVLIDPGPSSAAAHLLEGLAGRTPRVLALTHIHLDHAGATGTLLDRFPDAEVWVHERGAPHLIDPAKLIASATRLYGDAMERLWGEVRPVDPERVRVLAGGETLGDFEVAYTPGHASHHVAYLHGPSGFAFAGDVAGVRIGDGPVLAPTPPPDIDVPLWESSLAKLAAWNPRAIVTTHFDVHTDVEFHLEAIGAALSDAVALARENDEQAFAQALRRRIAERAGEETAAVYEQALPPGQSYLGLRRFLERAQAG